MMSADKKMSVTAFAGGLCCAIIIDIIGIFVPIIGSIFIGFMALSFWIAGYNMKGNGTTTAINALAELLPVIPSCTIFMISSFLKNRKNTKKKTPRGEKGEEHKEDEHKT